MFLKSLISVLESEDQRPSLLINANQILIIIYYLLSIEIRTWVS